MNRILFVLMLLALAACDSKSARFPEGVVGILHVDSGTEYVFRSTPTEIGGACAGWNTVSIQPPGQYSTNRLGALDPAVKRRAADILSFERPSEIQRHAVLSGALQALGLTSGQIEQLVSVTGRDNGRHGFTFSDLTQRLLPSIVLDAYPARGVDPARALEIAQQMHPTPPFEEQKP